MTFSREDILRPLSYCNAQLYRSPSSPLHVGRDAVYGLPKPPIDCHRTDRQEWVRNWIAICSDNASTSRDLKGGDRKEKSVVFTTYHLGKTKKEE